MKQPEYKGLTKSNGHCTLCGRRLRPEKTVWLELDQRNDTYTDAGDVPREKSQGAFPFGPGCAKSELARTAIIRGQPVPKP